MTPEDLARVHAACFPHRPWDAKEFAALLSRKGALLSGDGRSFVLGNVVLDEAEILTVATDPAHQRQGLARMALQAFEARAASEGAERVFLEVAADNVAARAMYRAAGYQQIGLRKGYYPGRIDALVLGKTLAHPAK